MTTSAQTSGGAAAHRSYRTITAGPPWETTQRGTKSEWRSFEPHLKLVARRLQFNEVDCDVAA